jgi:peroxiredoxin
MSLKESNMLSLGTQAPDFNLPDTVSGRELSLNDIKGENGTIIIFSCNHCPFVIHVNSEMVALAHDYAMKGIKMVVISSNDVVNYPMDAPDKMSIVAKVLQYPFPYLYDATQDVAKDYDAACTPDIYLFDSELKLYYRGRLDGSRPGNNIPLTGTDIREALDLLIDNKPAPEKQYPSAGCNIKWKN